MYTQLGSSQKMKKNYAWKFFSFIAGVVDTSEQPLFAIISANFRKKSKRSQRHAQGPGGHDLQKKLTSKISCQTSFKCLCLIGELGGREGVEQSKRDAG